MKNVLNQKHIQNHSDETRQKISLNLMKKVIKKILHIHLNTTQQKTPNTTSTYGRLSFYAIARGSLGASVSQPLALLAMAIKRPQFNREKESLCDKREKG
jgi:hypothetical protein